MRLNISIFLSTLLICILKLDNIFFWDNIVQLSIPANWYYDNNFANLYIPSNIGTGHPTFISMYVALVWKIFGQSLAITHFAFFPFIYGFLLETYKLIKNFVATDKQVLLVLFVVLIEATIVTQISALSFAICHLYFLVLSVNSIIKNKKVLFAFAFIGLMLISLRSAISGFGILAFYLFYKCKSFKKEDLNFLLYALPGLILFSIFLFTFYLDKGWIIHNTASGKWSSSSDSVNIEGFLQNIFYVIIRLIDYGKIVIWSIIVYLVFKIFFRKNKPKEYETIFLTLVITQLVFFLIVILPSNNTIGYKYLIPVTYFASILTGIWLIKMKKRTLYIFSCIILVAGNFIVYPRDVAQGWDSTPMQWVYFQLRDDAISFIKEKNIPFNKVGTFFPNYYSFYNVDLQITNLNFKVPELDIDRYIFYSNAFNLSDSDLNKLFSENWKKLKSFKKLNVEIILFERIEK